LFRLYSSSDVFCPSAGYAFFLLIFHTPDQTIALSCAWVANGGRLKRGAYRWLILVLIASLLVHWIHQSTLLPQLDWKVASDLALSILFASVLWLQFLRYLRRTNPIAARYHFEIVLSREVKLNVK
jgi:hypothetical protein